METTLIMLLIIVIGYGFCLYHDYYVGREIYDFEKYGKYQIKENICENPFFNNITVFEILNSTLDNKGNCWISYIVVNSGKTNSLIEYSKLSHFKKNILESNKCKSKEKIQELLNSYNFKL